MHFTEKKTDRRIISDRRKQPDVFINTYAFNDRRRTIRRESDKKKRIFSYSYSPQLFVILLSLLILSLLDAYLTLTLIHEKHIVEANPVMAFYLEAGNIPFIFEKFLFTTLSIFIFCLYSRFPITKFSLVALIIIYSAVVLYELNILYNLYPELF
jgi:hypothetical protein